MLHTQNMQNQCFRPNLLSCFLTCIQSEKMFQHIWISLKYKAKNGYLFPVLLTLFLTPWQLQAAERNPHDRISFRVADQTRDVREQAFQRGLNAMFVRFSGDSGVMKKLESPESRIYVQQFSYEPLNTFVIDSKGEILSQRIKIRYNTDLIEKYLRENGLADIVDENQTQSIAHIEIEAVNSMAKYSRVENYLTQLSAVKTVNALQTDGEKALFEIILRSSETAFLSAINNDGKLSKVKVETVAEQAGSLLVNNSKAIALKTIALKTNSNTKFNPQSESSALAIESPLGKKHQINLPDTASTPVPLADVLANQTPVYHYRLVR